MAVSSFSGSWRPAVLAVAMVAILTAQPASAEYGESPAGAYLAGNSAQARSDLAAASHYLAAALAHDPENTDLLRRAFHVSLSGGEADMAAELAARLVQHDPQDQLAETVLIVEDLRAGRYQVARKRSVRLERSGIATILAPMVEAWTAAAMDDVDTATSVLDDVAARPGVDAMAYLYKGMILDRADRTTEAREAYEAALERGGTTLRLVQALGALYERTGAPDRARALYNTYMEQNADSEFLNRDYARLDQGEAPAPVPLDPEVGVADALFQIASLLNREQAEIALSYARLAHRLDPHSGLGPLLVAEMLKEAERYEDALVVLRGVDEGHLAAPAAAEAIATTLDRMGRSDEAVEMLTRLADERSDDAEILVMLGDIERGERRFQEAADAYDAAAARDPSLAQDDWTFLYRRGIALERLQNWERAEQDLVRAIELKPDFPHLLNYLGYSWVDRGIRLDEAEALIRRAVDLNSEDGFIIDSLGWVYYRTGRLDEAVPLLERAVELEPGDSELNDHLGDAYWMAGRRIEATFQWRHALRTADDADRILEIEKKLAHGLTDPQIIGGPVTSDAAGRKPDDTPVP